VKRIGIFLLCIGFVCLLTCKNAAAQATGQITGTAKDQSGAVLPGVEIAVTQSETGATRSTVTNEAGLFVLPTLPLGSYQLQASLPGFRTYVEAGIVLQVGSNLSINPVMEVGQTTENIEVQANVAQVETREVGVGRIMETARILELPLNGRQVENLITLSGAAVPGPAMSNRAYGGERISSAGGLAFGVDYTLDGAVHMNFATISGQKLPFPDALAEFNLHASGLSADANTASTVSAVTKSGTNQFHGDLFEFLRNDLFNARQYFAITHSTLKRNQFGGVVGGPIIRNKLFFFGGYQGTITRQDPANVQAFLPTPAMLAGDFTTFASTQCQTRAITLRAPFVNNRVDPALFSKAALNIVKQLPAVNNPCGLITYGQRSPVNDYEIVGRADYQQSASHTLFGRYYVANDDQPSAWKSNPTNFLLAPVVEFNSQIASTTFGSTYVVSNSIVNSLRATYVNLWILRKGNSWFSACDMGVNIYCGLGGDDKFMQLTISGGFNLNQASRPGDHLNTKTYDIEDMLSWTKGNHQLSFGGGLNRTYHNAITSSQAAANLSFTTQFTGAGLGDFLLGDLSQISQGLWNHRPERWYTKLYVADAWKARPNLTVTYGLRWEPYLPEQRTNKAAYSFDYKRFQQGIKTSVYANAPAGFYYPGDQGFPNGNAGQNDQLAQFSPRLGFGWDVGGRGRTSVRGSYAYSYENIGMENAGWVIAAPPFGNLYTITNPAGGLDDPWRGIGNPFPAAATLNKNTIFGASGGYVTEPYDMKVSRTSSWNLSMQRQFGANSILSVTYLGNLTTHIQGLQALNPSIYIPGGPCVLPDGKTYNPCSTTSNTDLRRKLSLERYADGRLIGYLSDYTPQGTQHYHGLLITLRSQPIRGVNINANYTYSHCLGDLVSNLSSAGSNPNVSYQIPDNRRFDFGSCDVDRRHLLNLTALGELPRFSNATLRAIGTGWRLSTIYTHSSGDPLAIIIGQDIALNGIVNQRPNQILANPYANRAAGPYQLYLNPEAFRVPATGTLGNMGRNSIVGPGTWGWDLALSRIFKVRESQQVEFRAEAFNVPNSFRPTDPNLNLTGTFFGQIRGSLDPRIMQFALKYIF
jgi:hypothetical protein